MSGPTNVDESYVTMRVGRDVRVVRKSGHDVTGRLAHFHDGTLVIVGADRRRERVPFGDLAALYVRG